MGGGRPVVTGSFETLEKGHENHVLSKLYYLKIICEAMLEQEWRRGRVILEHDMLHVCYE